MQALTIIPEDASHAEILSALFSDMLTHGVVVEADRIIAYVTEEERDAVPLKEALADWRQRFPFTLECREVPFVNWNQEWERHYPPVVVDDFVMIRAHFHPAANDRVEHILTIQPRMSFGTGHHATTEMMIRAMKVLPVRGAGILDAGTGTGVLAILAARLGAREVVGIDNDPNCMENAAENLADNAGLDGSPLQVKWLLGSAEKVVGQDFDIILANINRNFLVDHADQLAGLIVPGGWLVISGFYESDARLLLDAYGTSGLVAQYLLECNSWNAVVFRKAASCSL